MTLDLCRPVRGLALIVVSALAACSGGSGGTTSPKVSLISIDIAPANRTIGVGETMSLTASGLDQTGTPMTPKSITWKSESPSIASVSSAGVVTGVGAGSTIITATSGAVVGATSVTVSPVVTSLSISPSSASVSVGSTMQLAAIARDAFGIAVSGKTISWTSANSGIAAVSANGLLTGVAQGSTSVTATVDKVQATALVIVTARSATLKIVNNLVSQVTISINNTPTTTVDGGATVSLTSTANPVTVSWALVRPTTSSGNPVGENMSGVFNPVSNPTGTITYDIDALVGSQLYFSPGISNNTSTRLLMGVNMGLQSENRCSCVIPIGSQRVHIGYYKLFSNTNVRAFRDGSSYTGSYTYWENFSSSVDTKSGDITLNATLNPGMNPLGPDVGTFLKAVRGAKPSGHLDDAIGMVPRP
jgi:hypothetical protein